MPSSPLTKQSSLRFSLIGGALMALGPLSIDMYLPAFASIAEDLNARPAAIQLSLAIFFAGITIGQLLYGPVSDRFGRKPPLIFGLILFILSTAACLFIHNAGALVVLRLFQAIGASAGLVISQVLVKDAFEPQRVGRVLSGLMIVMGIAPIIAPMMGGFVLAVASWRLIFVCLSMLGLFVLLAVIFILPETAKPNPDIRFSRVFHVYFNLLKDPYFLRISLSRNLANAGMFAYITAAPFIFIKLLGISTQNFGWVFGANALAIMLGSVLNGRWLKRHAMERLLSMATVGILGSGVLVVISGFLPLNTFVILVPLALFMFTLGVIMPNSTALALAEQKAHTGSASALLGSMQFAIACLVSGAVSAASNGNVHAMTIGIGVCALLSFASYFFKRQQQ